MSSIEPTTIWDVMWRIHRYRVLRYPKEYYQQMGFPNCDFDRYVFKEDEVAIIDERVGKFGSDYEAVEMFRTLCNIPRKLNTLVKIIKVD